MTAHDSPARDRLRTEILPETGAGIAGDRDRVGTVLGSYEVVALLGSGGMGCVFHALHVKLGREVALKLLRGNYASQRDAVARFFHEARTVNRVRHRNIVDVTDFVELPDGTTFIVMEFLRGRSLAAWMRGGFDLARALAVLVQICDGLSAAHEVGVVHRDLKPDNIFVVPTSDGADLVKLLDFGIAKLLHRDDEDIGFQTMAGAVIGTPAYMSPEQANGFPVDPRSDIYSLGAIMYEIVCGRPLFHARSFGEYAYKHNSEPPVPPRANGASIDASFEALILKCLAKEPGDRFANILDLRDALLDRFGAHTTVPPPTTTGARSQLSSSFQPPPARRRTWLAGGAVALALGAGAAIWIASRSESLPAVVEPVPAAPPAIAPLPEPPVPEPPAPAVSSEATPPAVSPDTTPPPVAPEATPPVEPPQTSGKRTPGTRTTRIPKQQSRSSPADADAPDEPSSGSPDKGTPDKRKVPAKKRVDPTDTLDPYEE